MTTEERMVLRLLERHAKEPLYGVGRYVPVKVLAELTGIHWRKVQAAIAGLINDHGYPIGHSCNAKDPGNKLLSANEIQDELDRLDRRARKIFVRKSSLKKVSMAQVVGEFHQQELWKDGVMTPEGEAA